LQLAQTSETEDMQWLWPVCNITDQQPA